MIELARLVGCRPGASDQISQGQLMSKSDGLSSIWMGALRGRSASGTIGSGRAGGRPCGDREDTTESCSAPALGVSSLNSDALSRLSWWLSTRVADRPPSELRGTD